MVESVCFPRLTSSQYNWLMSVALKERDFFQMALNQVPPIPREYQNTYQERLDIAKETVTALLLSTAFYPANQPDVELTDAEFDLIESALHLYHAYFEKQTRSGVTDAEYLERKDKIPQVFWKLKKLRGE